MKFGTCSRSEGSAACEILPSSSTSTHDTTNNHVIIKIGSNFGFTIADIIL